MPFFRFFSLFILVFVAACSEQETGTKSGTPVDIFSYANTDQVVVRHIDLDLTINFEEKVLGGTAVLRLDYVTPGAETLVLDARNLTIEKVEAGAGENFSETTFSLGESHALLGEALTIDLPRGAEAVKITYQSNLGASGLMWLSAEQTAGKEYPFMFSQSQAIHARSWVPLQDSPSVRFTYTATLRTPPELIALMSASQDPDGVRDGEYHFDMPQAIPSYLMAIAVGDLEFRAISEGIGVYAESYIVDQAAFEFGETPEMMVANETLYGPYRWAIHARSWVPLQDSPSVRFTYTATLRTPPELIALMSASQDPDGVRDGEYHFDMPQAIPSYLMAIAVGDLEFRAISEGIGVYAESYIVDQAAFEFGETPEMMVANETLYGPYRWGRYDMLVLPPSFPYGGMENPRMTFLTPTLVAGDRSLTNVIAHELAHSWAGNQVTNATWPDGWINEGITSYVENRVMEIVYGRERAVMEQVLAKAAWMATVEGAEDPAETALKYPVENETPEMYMSQVVYEKGQFFLTFLEESYGREIFDPFLKGFFDAHAFQSLTTENFQAYLKENLMDANPGVVDMAVIEEWLYAAGVPASSPNPVSDVFERLEVKSAAWLAGELATDELGSDKWTAHEWLHFINNLPGDLALEHFYTLDSAFGLTNSTNAEVAFAWYMKSLEGGYSEIGDSLRQFLIRVGRGKFLYPIYAGSRIA